MTDTLPLRPDPKECTGFMGSHRSHRFVPDGDGDNMECVYCMCRPYGDDAKAPCSPGC